MRKIKAVQEFSRSCNCCQSVVKVFCSDTGISEKLAEHMAAGFGGGMALMQKTCGAVTGAYMVLGMLNGKKLADTVDVKQITNQKIDDFNSRFLENFQSLECKALVGYDFHVAEEKKIFDDENLKKKICEKLVSHAVEIIEEMEML